MRYDRSHTNVDGGNFMTWGDRGADQQNAAAIRDAQAAERRLREAIDILPEGIVFLDREGRYILWNQQYADIYKRSADLFKVGVKLADTLRIGVARGDYPAAAGREEEWMAERLDLMRNPGPPHEQVLSDGRVVLIEERKTSDGGTIGLRVDITEMKQREASFRLLFDENPLPMFVCAVDGERILAANDAAVAHYGHDRATLTAGNPCRHPRPVRALRDRRYRRCTGGLAGGPHLAPSQGRRQHHRCGGLRAPADL